MGVSGNVAFEVSKTQLVSILVLPIVWTVLLDGIVCEMDEVIVESGSISVVGHRRCAKVAFSEEEDIHVLVEEHPHSDVKLALVDETWSLDVLLDDEGG